MSKTIELNSIEDLIDFFESTDLTGKEANEVLYAALQVYGNPTNKIAFIRDLKAFWKQYKDYPGEWPLFIDADCKPSNKNEL